MVVEGIKVTIEPAKGGAHVIRDRFGHYLIFLSRGGFDWTPKLNRAHMFKKTKEESSENRALKKAKELHFIVGN